MKLPAFNRSILTPVLRILGLTPKETPQAKAKRLYTYYLTASGTLFSKRPSEPVTRTIKAPSFAAAKSLA